MFEFGTTFRARSKLTQCRSGNPALRASILAACIFAPTLSAYGQPGYSDVIRAGDEALENGRLEKARQHYVSAMSHRGTGGLGAAGRLALVAWMTGDCRQQEQKASRSLQLAQARATAIKLEVQAGLQLLYLAHTQGKYDEVSRRGHRLLELHQKHQLPRYVADIKDLLAFAEFVRGNPRSARQLIRSRNRVLLSVSDPIHLLVATANQGKVALDDGRINEAIGHLGRAIGKLEKNVSSEYPSLVYMLQTYAIALQKAGRDSEAGKAWSKAKRIAKSGCQCRRRISTFRAPR